MRSINCCDADYDLKTKQRQPLYIACKAAGSADVLQRGSGLIGTLALSDAVKVGHPFAPT